MMWINWIQAYLIVAVTVYIVLRLIFGKQVAKELSFDFLSVIWPISLTLIFIPAIFLDEK